MEFSFSQNSVVKSFVGFIVGFCIGCRHLTFTGIRITYIDNGEYLHTDKIAQLLVSLKIPPEIIYSEISNNSFFIWITQRIY